VLLLMLVLILVSFMVLGSSLYTVFPRRCIFPWACQAVFPTPALSSALSLHASRLTDCANTEPT